MKNALHWSLHSSVAFRNNLEIIDVYCFKPLSLGMVCYTAKDNNSQGDTLGLHN